MEQVLCNLIEYIGREMPELALVDEDYGQLENLKDGENDMYPITFPSVLIDAPETDWSDLSGGGQKGECRLRVRLLIDCYDDTHMGSGTTFRVRERQEMRQRLHGLLQGYRPLDDGVLVRTKSAFFTWWRGIKVYEQTYTLTLTELLPGKATALRPQVRLSASLLPPGAAPAVP